jgi:hypothetical protein
MPTAFVVTERVPSFRFDFLGILPPPLPNSLLLQPGSSQESIAAPSGRGAIDVTERLSRSWGTGLRRQQEGRDALMGRTQAHVDDCPTARVVRGLAAGRKTFRLD